MKFCSRCEVTKPLSAFFRHVSAPDGVQYICKACQVARRQEYKKAKRDGTWVDGRKLRALDADERHRRILARREARQASGAATIYVHGYYLRHKAALIAAAKRRGREVRRRGILEYGGRCSCCGETEVKFLTLEHIDGRKGDSRPRRNQWWELKRLGWPRDGFTVLCWNCNCAKGVYGICPHKDKEGKPDGVNVYSV